MNLRVTQSEKEKGYGKRYILSVLFSALAFVTNFLITFFLTRAVTERIGVEANGFVSMAKTVASYTLILTVALNSFAARFISIAYHKGDFEKANRYFSSIFIADIVLSVFLLFSFSILIIFLEKIFVIPSELILDVKILFLLDLINFCISSCSTVFLCSCIIKNRLDLGNLFKFISYFLEGVFLFIAFFFLTPKIYFVGIGLIISSLFILVSDFFITRKFTPELTIEKKYISLSAVKEVVFPGLWNSINMLGNTLNSGLDLIVSNLLLNAVKTGLLSIVKSVSTIFISLFQLVSVPFQPFQLKAYSNGNREKLIDSFKYGIKFNGCLSNVLFGGFAIFGAVFFKLWVPSQDGDLLQSICLITILATAIEGAVYPLYFAYTLTLKNKVPCIVTIASGLINVVSMLILLKLFNADLFGVVITTTVLAWLVNFIFNPIYSAKCLNLKATTFYPCLVRHIISTAAVTGVFYCISLIIYPSDWLSLIIIAAVCAIIGAIIHFVIVFDKKDWILVFSKLRRKKLSD